MRIETGNRRIAIESTPLSDAGFAAHVLRTRETLVINENIEEETSKIRQLHDAGHAERRNPRCSCR